MADFNFDAITDKIEDLVDQIKGDDKLLAKFKKNPEAVIKSLVPDNLISDDKLDGVIKLIRAKLGDDVIEDVVEDVLEGALGKMKGLFGK
ncbi:MAG: hypothetical protein IJ468_01750 [Lachnospiraceae bacterium]|nr:hypothetical protein [Lachnospiraceae bacterium]